MFFAQYVTTLIHLNLLRCLSARWDCRSSLLSGKEPKRPSARSTLVPASVLSAEFSTIYLVLQHLPSDPIVNDILPVSYTHLTLPTIYSV